MCMAAVLCCVLSCRVRQLACCSHWGLGGGLPSPGSLVVEELLDTGSSSACAHRAFPRSAANPHRTSLVGSTTKTSRSTTRWARVHRLPPPRSAHRGWSVVGAAMWRAVCTRCTHKVLHSTSQCLGLDAGPAPGPDLLQRGHPAGHVLGPVGEGGNALCHGCCWVGAPAQHQAGLELAGLLAARSQI